MTQARNCVLLLGGLQAKTRHNEHENNLKLPSECMFIKIIFDCLVIKIKMQPNTLIFMTQARNCVLLLGGLQAKTRHNEHENNLKISSAGVCVTKISF